MNVPIHTTARAPRQALNPTFSRETRLSATSPEEDALGDYLARIGRHRLLGAEDEVTLARELRAGKRAWWLALMGEPRLLAALAERCEHLLEPGQWAELGRACTWTVDPILRSQLADVLVDADPDMHAAADLSTLLVERVDDEPPLRATLARVRAAQAAVQATKDRFVAANLRLVVKVAMQHQRRGLPTSDLIQDGNIGLMKAVDRFDHRRGFRFSTYATHWIKCTIARGIANHGRTIRVPSAVRQTCGRIARASDRLHTELGRPATTQELASAIEASATTVSRARAAMLSFVSLETPVGDEGGQCVGDRLADEHAHEFAETIDDHSALIREALRSLSPIEADVLRHRFGLDDGRERTLREIGEANGLSRERIRQLEQRALKKLRRRLGSALR